MHRFFKSEMARPVAAVAFLVLGFGSPCRALADDSRSNPFQPTASADEEHKLQDKERLRDAIRDLMPELRAKVAEDLESQRAANAESEKRSILEALKNDPNIIQRATQPGPTAGVGPATAAGVAALGEAAAPQAMEQTPVPDGAEFVACLNGKELYKDTVKKVRFFRDLAPGTVSPCNVRKLAALSPKKPDVVQAVGQALAAGAAGAGGMVTGAPGFPAQAPGQAGNAQFPGGQPGQGGRPGIVVPPMPQPAVVPAGAPRPGMPGQPASAAGQPSGVPGQPGRPATAVSAPVAPRAPATAVPPAQAFPPGVPGSNPAAPNGQSAGTTQPAPGTQGTTLPDMAVGYRYPRPVGK